MTATGPLGEQVRIERAAGRRAFGADPEGYATARPGYPDRVYELLVERCGLGPGTATLEIGPGTGIATEVLLAKGANPLVAVEPDERLSDYLRSRMRRAGRDVDVRSVGFEDASLPDACFDLAVSATAFHWVDPEVGLREVARVLRPGAAWSMWWTVFGDPERPDPFHEATIDLLQRLRDGPSTGVSWRAPFALDREQRCRDMERTGAFEEIGFECLSWTLELTADRVRALYGTFSSVAALPRDRRELLLDGIHDVAQREFGGRVERRVLTPVYTARRRP